MADFYLSSSQIKAIASLVHVAPTLTSNEPSILKSIRIDVTQDSAMAYASDRKTAARVSFPLSSDVTESSVLLSAEDAKRVAATKCGGLFSFEPTGSNRAQHVVTFDADLRTAATQPVTLTADDGNFPPIERLFPTFKGHDTAEYDLPTGIGMDLNRLAMLGKLSLPGETDKHRREAAWVLNYTGAGHAPGNRILKPVLATRGDVLGGKLAVLIQPVHVFKDSAGR